MPSPHHHSNQPQKNAPPPLNQITTSQPQPTKPTNPTKQSKDPTTPDELALKLHLAVGRALLGLWERQPPKRLAQMPPDLLERLFALLREVMASLEEDDLALAAAAAASGGAGGGGGPGGDQGGGRGGRGGGGGGGGRGGRGGPPPSAPQQLLDAFARFVDEAGGAGAAGLAPVVAAPPRPFAPDEAEVAQLMEMVRVYVWGRGLVVLCASCAFLVSSTDRQTDGSQTHLLAYIHRSHSP